MRRIVLVGLSTITTLVLLFNYHTSTNSAAVVTNAVSRLPAVPGRRPAPSPSPNKSAATSPKPSVASYTGDVADTRWGPVQVQITVKSRRITASQAVEYPQGNGHDAEINGFALPILDSEVVQKQAASIDTVSGATVTSDGYLQSLQSAIDRAHL